MRRNRARDEAILRQYEESSYSLYDWRGDGKHRRPTRPYRAKIASAILALVMLSGLGSGGLQSVSAAPPLPATPQLLIDPYLDARQTGIEDELRASRADADRGRRVIPAPRKTIVSAARRVVKKPAPAPRPNLGRAEVVIRFALAQVGKQYVWGADGPDSYDCSGLVMRAYQKVGISLPHQSGAMLSYGKRVSRSELRRGDLVWPQSGHVAIYLGNNKIVHASNPRTDVKVSSLYSFWTARRLL